MRLDIWNFIYKSFGKLWATIQVDQGYICVAMTIMTTDSGDDMEI